MGINEAVIKGIKTRITSIAIAIAVLVASVLFALLTRRLMRRSLKGRLPEYMYKPIENIVFYSIIFAGVVAALYPLGINLSGLIVAGGIAGIVIGFASQQAVSNLISGMFLLMEQPLRIGDPVSLEGVEGVVSDINVFSTKVRTWDGTIVRIPNSTVFTSIITNYYRTRARRVEIRIGLSYDTDIEKALEVLHRLMDEHPFCLVNPAPEVFVQDYGDSAIVFTMRCWAPPPVWFRTKVELQTRLKEELDKAGIEIPFPQLDLHVKDVPPIRLSKK